MSGAKLVSFLSVLQGIYIVAMLTFIATGIGLDISWMMIFLGLYLVNVIIMARAILVM